MKKPKRMCSTFYYDKRGERLCCMSCQSRGRCRGRCLNLPDLGKAKFAAAAKELRDKGFSVLNPAELPDGMPATRYMPICLSMVQAADTVYALDNWKDSNGARIEVRYARYQGKNIVFQEAEP